MKKAVLWFAAAALLCGASAASAQTVWYNTEGGRYYHADPHCDAIDEKYWDEMAETTTAYTDRLGLRGPCSRCFDDAPSVPASQMAAKGEGKTLVQLQFGGSEPDEASDMALTPQGQIVLAGHTSSTDGTLSDRTKSGWSGWLTLVDTKGNTLWNFCSRHASMDRMRAPVAHDDGTITVMLESRGNEYHQMELIRLNMQGEVLSRKPLVRLEKGDGELAPETPAAFAGGYVFATYNEKKKIDYQPVPGSRKEIYQPKYHFFDFEGNLLGTTQAYWHNAVAAVGDRHVIEAIDRTYWLCAIGEKGERTKLVSLFDGLQANKEYRAVVSLADGGAAAALYEYGGYDMKTTLQRWDAQGNLVSAITLGDFLVNHLEVCGSYLVVSGETAKSRHMLLAFADDGQLVCREELSSGFREGRALIALDEDTVVCARLTGGGQRSNSKYYNWDVQLSIIDIAR